MDHRELAHFLLRVYVAVNIGMHGAVRLPKLGQFADAMAAGFAETPLPASLVRGFAFGLAPVETIIGLALLLGIRLEETLSVGLFLISVLTFGVVLQERWDVAGLQVIYALTYFVLLFTLPYARWCLVPSRSPFIAEAPPSRTQR